LKHAKNTFGLKAIFTQFFSQSGTDFSAVIRDLSAKDNLYKSIFYKVFI